MPLMTPRKVSLIADSDTRFDFRGAAGKPLVNQPIYTAPRRIPATKPPAVYVA
jgi:hypothetical protein